MKIKIWNAIVDNGDGSSSSLNFKSKQELIEYFENGYSENDEERFIDHSDVYDGATIFDQYDYPVEISVNILDTTGYEIVE